MLYLDLVLNPNIELCHSIRVRLCRYIFLLSEIIVKYYTPAKHWCDNQAAFHIASILVYHERTKHIETGCHFIREKIQFPQAT